MNKIDKKHFEESKNGAVGINEKTASNTLNDLTNNDGNEGPGAELDTIINYTNKKKFDKAHPKPQADEVLNPGLSTDNNL